MAIVRRDYNFITFFTFHNNNICYFALILFLQ